MNHWLRTTAILLVTFTLSALISQLFLYDRLDNLVINNFNAELLEHKTKIQAKFQHAPPDSWQHLAAELADELDTTVFIDERSPEFFASETLEQLAAPMGKAGIADIEQGQVFYPLSDDYVLSAGPFDSFLLAYINEIVTWLLALLAALASFAIQHYLDQRQLAKLARALSDEPPADARLSLDRLIARARQIAAANDQKAADISRLLTTQRDLLHGVAHEFKSPLARMEFALELLDEADDAKKEQLTQQLERSIQDLDELVKQLLRYSRLQHDESELQICDTSLDELVDTALHKVSGFYPKITFRRQGPHGARLACDAKLMVLALSNILRNAGRFARSQCQIDIRETNTALVIGIQDDGSGLPPGKRQQIFEPFTRLDPSRSRDSGGYGLGLAIVQSIIHRHRGEIHVEDAKLGGANFVLTLPRSTLPPKD